MSNWFGTSKQNTSSTSTTQALPEQQGYLSDVWSQAKNIFNNASGVADPTNFVAGFNPGLIDTFKSMLGYGSGMNTAATGAAGANLATAGAGAAQGALSRLGLFNPTGGADSNIAEANKYASGANVDDMVNAAMRPVETQVREQTLPGLARSGAANGTINSNRSALAEGVVARDLANQRSDLGANIRGQLYSTGLDRAEQGRQFDTNSMLDSIKSLISGGTGAATTGSGLSGDAISQQGGLFGLAQQGGQGLTDANQADINNILAKYGFDTTHMSDLLNNYYAMVGDLKGSTSTGNSTTTSTASPAAIIGGLLTSFGSLIPGKK